MATNAVAENAVSESPYGLAQLSDGELLASTRRLVGSSNQLFAALLAHLAEVDARGLHRTRACASLYTYCVYELRFSEDAAFRRVTAAKWVRQFPALFDAIARGELHLTGVLMLGPHLTPENHLEVLALAKHRTKKEIAQLVRRLDPLPEVPARIEPLGPALPPRVDYNPSWEKAMLALNPVRHLPPGQRPRDWMADSLPLQEPTVENGSSWAFGVTAMGQSRAANERPQAARPNSVFDATSPPPRAVAVSAQTQIDVTPAPARNFVAAACGYDVDAGPAPARIFGAAEPAARRDSHPDSVPVPAWLSANAAPAERDDVAVLEAGGAAAAPRLDLAALSEPLRYVVQFTASQEYVQLVEHAQALLSQTAGRESLAELHFRALRALVAQLEKRKYARHGQAEPGVASPVAHSAGLPLAEPARSQPGAGAVCPSVDVAASGDVESYPSQDNATARRRNDGTMGTSLAEDTAAPQSVSQPEEPIGSQPEKAVHSRSEETVVSRLKDAVVSPPGAGASPARIGGCSTGSGDAGAGSRRGGAEPRQRGRHVPAAIRREVFGRDGQRCTFVDDSGRRCCEARGLELHHLQAFARGGAHSVGNLTLRCHAHNALAAEADFGRDVMARKRETTFHEAFAAQKLSQDARQS